MGSSSKPALHCVSRIFIRTEVVCLLIPRMTTRFVIAGLTMIAGGGVSCVSIVGWDTGVNFFVRNSSCFSRICFCLSVEGRNLYLSVIEVAQFLTRGQVFVGNSSLGLALCDEIFSPARAISARPSSRPEAGLYHVTINTSHVGCLHDHRLNHCELLYSNGCMFDGVYSEQTIPEIGNMLFVSSINL